MATLKQNVQRFHWITWLAISFGLLVAVMLTAGGTLFATGNLSFAAPSAKTLGGSNNSPLTQNNDLPASPHQQPQLIIRERELSKTQRSALYQDPKALTQTLYQEASTSLLCGKTDEAQFTRAVAMNQSVISTWAHYLSRPEPVGTPKPSEWRCGTQTSLFITSFSLSYLEESSGPFKHARVGGLVVRTETNIPVPIVRITIEWRQYHNEDRFLLVGTHIKVAQ